MSHRMRAAAVLLPVGLLIGVLLRVVLIDVEMPPYRTVQAGYGRIRLHARAGGAPSASGEHEIFFRNGNAPRGATYQVNAVSGAQAPVTLGAQARDAAQQQSRITYRIGAGAPAPPATASGAGGQTGRLAGVLESRSLSLTAVLLAVVFAALLGALHALTPGHAKTLMAAYLVGSGGTTRNAVTLGAVVTFTHTASVIVIGLLALFAGQFLVPGVLVPALEVASGVLVRTPRHPVDECSAVRERPGGHRARPRTAFQRAADQYSAAFLSPALRNISAVGRELHQPQGLLPTQNDGVGPALYAWTFLAIAVFGAGPWSLDALWRRRVSANPAAAPAAATA
jgi:hypothetical protein